MVGVESGSDDVGASPRIGERSDRWRLGQHFQDLQPFIPSFDFSVEAIF